MQIGPARQGAPLRRQRGSTLSSTGLFAMLDVPVVVTSFLIYTRDDLGRRVGMHAFAIIQLLINIVHVCTPRKQLEDGFLQCIFSCVFLNMG